MRKQTEICKLYPPAMAGELSLLDPWNGVEQSTVVADTYVEMLVLNKKQIDHRKFSKKDIIRVKTKSIAYPTSSIVVGKFDAEEKWDGFKNGLVNMVDKRKWPLDANGMRLVHLHHGGGTVVAPKIDSRGPMKL